MKTLLKINLIILILTTYSFKVLANENIKIGLIVPLSGEYAEIGNSIINSIRLAVNEIDDSRIEILPRDTMANPNVALNVAKDLYQKDVKIIIGPLFGESSIYLNELDDVTFLSFTNKLHNNHLNVISTGVNAISQIKTIKKFQKKEKLERSIFLIPKADYKIEIENAIAKTKIKLKDKYFYDTDPTILTSQIEKITRYPQRKQNLEDEINRVENSDDADKERKLDNLKRKDTLGGINFDSVIIADFEENLKSVTTSLLYTDVSSNRVKYISLNQWFDESLLKEKTLQPIYFPSVNKKNYEKFTELYKSKYNSLPNQVSFLSYDILGLVYYLIYINDFDVSRKIFYEKNKFKGKIGIFEINKNIITHELSLYSADDGKFKKIF